MTRDKSIPVVRSVTEFNPDHDETGRFASGGAGASAGTSSDAPPSGVSASDKSVGETAEKLSKKAESAEPVITQSMKTIISGKEGASLERLAYARKTQESIDRKIRSIMDENPGMTAEDAAKNIRDTVRYTAVLDDDNFSAQAQSTHNSTKSAAEKREMEIKFFKHRQTGEGVKMAHTRIECTEMMMYKMEDEHLRDMRAKLIAARTALRTEHAAMEDGEKFSTPAGRGLSDDIYYYDSLIGNAEGAMKSR